jgi:hypothetical protein
VTYSLWETNSANILGTFDSESEALALVRDVAGSMGADYIDSFSLTRTGDDGSVTGVAAGPDLLKLALRNRAGAA